MKRIFIFLMLVLFSPIVLAQTADLNTYQFQIAYGKVLVEHNLNLNTSEQINLNYTLPKDATAVSVYINDEKQDIVFEQGNLLLKHSSAKKIKIEYITKELLEKNTFLANIDAVYDTKELRVVLILPEGAVLNQPIENGISGSIFPKPTAATTDGKNLIFGWKKLNLDKTEEMAIFMGYKPKTEFPIITLLTLVAIIGALLGYVYTRKEKVRTIVKKEESIEKHLKEDEEQIVNILKKREGQCEQGTLRVITGFSKASLSRLLKELEDRKIVHKEQRGKKNLVFLRKQ